MSVRDEQRERVTERLSAHLLETGLAKISLRQLAAAAGVSDRMLLYYFTDKPEALAAAMGRVAGELAGKLATALPDGVVWSPDQLIRRAAEFTTRPEMRRFMRLWVEVIAAAARSEQPFVGIAAQIMEGFRHWVETRLDLPAGTDREAVAAAVIATIDGLALVDICAGEALATRAAAALSLLQPRRT